MSYNVNVETAKQKTIDIYFEFGQYSDEYNKAKDHLYEVMEVEAKNDEYPFSWLDMEDPFDVLVEALYNNDDVDFVEILLEDYIRFNGLVLKVTGEDRTDKFLIEGAMEYIAEKKNVHCEF